MNSLPLKIRLFGAVEVVRGDKPLVIQSRSSQALLAYLLLKPHTQHRREKIASDIWAEAGEENSRAYLRNALWVLRKIAGGKFFLADKNLVGINPAAEYQLDVDRLSGLKGQNGSIETLMEVLDSYRGELLADFYDDWIVTEREHLNRLYVSHFVDLLEKLQKESRWQQVIEWGEKLIRNDEAPEKAFRILMKAYAEAGEISNVTSVYQRCIRFLKQQLDVAPSAETEALYQNLIHKTLAPVAAPARSRRSAMPKPARSDKRVPKSRRTKRLRPILLATVLGALSFSLIVFNSANSGIVAEGAFANGGLAVQAANWDALKPIDIPLFARVPIAASVPISERKEVRTGSDGTIRISSVDGSEYSEVKVENLFVMGASWMPDGKRLVIWADPRGDVSYLAQGNFYVINADGTGIVQVTNDGDRVPKGRPTLSSDGTRILYSDGGSINILNLLDGSLQNIVPSDNGLSWLTYAFWSSDDSKIVFLRVTPNCWCPNVSRVTVINSDGTNPQVIYLSPLGYEIATDSVGFSPDGTQVGFQGKDLDEWHSYTVEINGGSQPEITSANVWTWVPTYYPQWGE